LFGVKISTSNYSYIMTAPLHELINQVISIDQPTKQAYVLFRFKKFLDFDTIVLSFVFDKYYLIMD